MKKYAVTLDYVMTATVLVEAKDAESAENKAWRHVHCKKGFDEYVKVAAPNNVLFGKRMWKGDGFDIPQSATEVDSTYKPDPKCCIDLTEGEL